MAGTGDNSKRKGKKANNHEPIKQAVANCVRSMSGQGDLEVTFSGDKPGMVGNQVRLPEFSKNMSQRQLAITRGLGDAMALRKACHNAAIHNRLSPEGDNARAIFDAMEQARVEAIGANRMQGVAKNLSHMLDDKYSKQNYSAADNRSDAPLEEAVAMVVRERLTGQKPPVSADGFVSGLWREWIEERAGEKLDNSATTSKIRRLLPKQSAMFLVAFDMGDELGDQQPEQDDRRRNRRQS